MAPFEIFEEWGILVLAVDGWMVPVLQRRFVVAIVDAVADDSVFLVLLAA